MRVLTSCVVRARRSNGEWIDLEVFNTVESAEAFRVAYEAERPNVWDAYKLVHRTITVTDEDI